MKEDKVRENQQKVEQALRKYSKMKTEEVLQEFGSSLGGLSIVEIDERIEEYGKNTIETNQNDSFFYKVKEALINPFNMVLILVAIITFITDVAIQENKDYATFLLIIGTVIISTVISLVQETKSDHAAKKLKQLITNKMDVLRDEVSYEVDVQDIVPGDVVKLSSGDMIPGDVRFIEAKDLFIDQASLTGESTPVEKFVTAVGNETITDIPNIGFMGTNIVSGSALAVVIATGSNTYFGSMAKSLYSINEQNSFEKGIHKVSNLLIRFMFVMLPIILAINIATKDSWWDSLLFAITIAVGLTPEMLPVIMTATMAKGAVEMSKKKTIVKRLNAIQTFGEMNILCTDKTGTLTEDEIVLEKYMDVSGKENIRILRHAFLNSYFQTGLKNLIDVAIITRAEKENLNVLKEKYVREDEIPFDFTRRRMSVVLKDDQGKRQLITKGAVDEIMSICSFIDVDGQVVEMTEETRKEAYRSI